MKGGCGYYFYCPCAEKRPDREPINRASNPSVPSPVVNQPLSALPSGQNNSGLSSQSMVSPESLNNCVSEDGQRRQPDNGTHQVRNRIYLFVGAQGSGKSTAIKNMFDGSPTTNLEYPLLVQTRIGTNAMAIEVPGFQSYIEKEQNTEIVSLIKNYLNDKIPDIIFVTAKLNDARFIGQASEFRYVLNHVRDLGIVADERENVVLLLTHKDRPDIALRVNERISQYQAEFHQVFSGDPMCICVGNKRFSRAELNIGASSTENIFPDYFLADLVE